MPCARGADQIAAQRDAIAIAARDLQDRLVAVRDENRGGREAADRSLAGRGVRDVDRVDLAFELAGLVQQLRACRRERRHDLRGDDELLRLDLVLEIRHLPCSCPRESRARYGYKPVYASTNAVRAAAELTR